MSCSVRYNFNQARMILQSTCIAVASSLSELHSFVHFATTSMSKLKIYKRAFQNNLHFFYYLESEGKTHRTHDGTVQKKHCSSTCKYGANKETVSDSACYSCDDDHE